MKLWRYIFKNVLRNKRRTILTLLSLGASIFIVNLLVSVLRGFDATDTTTDTRLQLITRHKVSLTNDLPEAYWEKIRQAPHVKVVTPWSWFGGVYKDQSFENQFARFSTDAASYLALTEGDRKMPAEEEKAWIEERRGAIAGKHLADAHHWKIGETVTIKGDIYPVDVELILKGIFTMPKTEDEDALLFHHMYLEELQGRPGRVGTYWLKVDAAENLPSTMKAVDRMFENSDAETLTETMDQFMADFVSMMGNVKGLLKAFSLAVAAVILMLAANTMAMAVRERTTEVAVMKAIGFPPANILAAILAESALIAMIACALGCLVSYTLFNLLGLRVPGLWTPMYLTLPTAAIAAGVALVVSLISGLIPGIIAARMNVVEGLRKVA